MEMGEQLPQLHGPLVRKTLRLIVHSLVEFPAEMRFSFVQWLLFSHSIVSNSLQSHGLQHNRLPCPSPSAGTCSDSCPLREWCHRAFSSSVAPFYSCALSFPSTTVFFQWVGSLHQVAKVLELHLQHLSFQWLFRVVFLLDWLFWSPWGPRDSQESSPAPQFKIINSLALSHL